VTVNHVYRVTHKIQV